MQSPGAALLVMAPLTFLMSLTPGLGAAIVQTITPSEMRGQLAAVYLFFASFLAMLLAPVVVALLMGSFFGGEMGLGAALSALAAVAYPLAAILLFTALPRYRAALRGAPS